MANAKNPKSGKSNGGKDNFTRNLVVAVVVGVALIMLVPTVLSKQGDSTAAIPATASVNDGYGLVFNGELTGVPFMKTFNAQHAPALRRSTALTLKS
jgi:hypothetical protein